METQKGWNGNLNEDVMEKIFLRGSLEDLRKVRAVSRRWGELFPALVSTKWAHYSPCFIHLAGAHNNSTFLSAFDKTTGRWERFPLHVYISRQWGRIDRISGARLRCPVLAQVYEVDCNRGHSTEVVCVSNIFTGDRELLPTIEGFKRERKYLGNLTLTYFLEDEVYRVDLEDVVLSYDSQGFTVGLIYRMIGYHHVADESYQEERFVEFEYKSLTSSWIRKVSPRHPWERQRRAVLKGGNVYSFGRACGVLWKHRLHPEFPREGDSSTSSERIEILDRRATGRRPNGALVVVKGKLMAVTLDENVEFCVYEVNEQSKQARRVSCANMQGRFGQLFNIDESSRRRCSSDGHSIFLWVEDEVQKNVRNVLVYNIEKKEWTELARTKETINWRKWLFESSYEVS